MDWDRWYVSAWYGWIALFILVEAYTALDRRISTPMLTNVIVRETRWYVTMTFLTWLWAHFFVRYIGWERIARFL